ncbi:MAG: class I SAM-dependent methyltransferase [Sphaerochaetaceae bacterium]|nr:class I SAM-dependent methyltransferase [Sphaerochaetaceae bacterium]
MREVTAVRRTMYALAGNPAGHASIGEEWFHIPGSMAMLGMMGYTLSMDYAEHNKQAWNTEVSRRNTWTIPVDSETIRLAREGRISINLTTFKPVPAAWLGGLHGKRVLCLAGGGGQQGPVLAAAGASVTVFDNSGRQLEQDRAVAKREGLDLGTEQGDMLDLSRFSDGSFDLIFNPISNCFIDRLQPVWESCYRLLSPGGRLLTGITNPVLYVFDEKAEAKGRLRVKYTLPYSDLTSLSRKELRKRIDTDDTIEFSHTLEEQLGGICKAGFAITGFYSDTSGFEPLDSFIADCYLAVMAEKRYC